MNLDHALEDLQDAAARSAGAPPVERITAVRRRRRTVRRAVAGAVGATGTAAVVLGAVWLSGGHPEPAPPVVSVSPSPSPSASPTPSPTAEPVSLPAGDPTLPFGVCGSVAGTEPVAPVTDVLMASVALDATEVRPGAAVPLTTVIAGVSEHEHPEFQTGVLPAQGARVLWLHDGVVVAVDDAFAGTYAGWETWHTAAFPGRSEVRSAQVPTVCEVGAALADQPRTVPLPAGDYEVVALGEIAPLGPEGVEPPIWDLDDAELQARAEEHGLLTVVSEPVAVTIAGTPVPATQAPQPADLTTFGDRLSAYTECGGPPPVPTPGAQRDALTVTFAPPPSTAPATEPVALEASVAYHGPGAALLAYFVEASLWLVQDGVVVGTTHAYTDVGYGSVVLPSGVGTAVSSVVAPGGCGSATPWEPEALPPGTYEAYPGVVVVNAWTYVDGVWQQQDLPGEVIYGEPFTLTLTE